MKRLIGPIVHTGQFFRQAVAWSFGPQHDSVYASVPTQKRVEVPEGHSCVKEPLPLGVWTSMLALPIQRCPSCAHPLGMHDVSGPCQGCYINLKQGLLESEINRLLTRIVALEKEQPRGHPH